MKRLVAVIALSAIAISPGYAQIQSHKGTAVVKKVDPAGGRVTLAHGPIRSIDWPAMTMAFKVKDKALLDKLAVDKKIEFEFVQQGSDYVITSIK
jgi:Cu(I)/Ag(I) efflux system protein CusF